MEGIWSAIADDLKNIKEAVQKDFKIANEIVAHMEATKLVNKWNDLKDSGGLFVFRTLALADAWTTVDKYRQAAYVTDVTTATLDDLSAQLHQQATK